MIEIVPFRHVNGRTRLGKEVRFLGGAASRARNRNDINRFSIRVRVRIWTKWTRLVD